MKKSSLETQRDLAITDASGKLKYLDEIHYKLHDTRHHPGHLNMKQKIITSLNNKTYYIQTIIKFLF